ncbi:LysR family transcriptional regulator [Rhodococcus fascians]|uniref:LysR family transcriptional regulator n=1 Tax=Nocardiaceae TaxID=85025 RepID=UPI00050C785F|nr:MULTISPECIES: LysR family transcriptional regulator [Rhodococcus]MDP9639208.1 DNA-binding transcriptional LysR family regulator [Rhodococcus cercidiphylli]RZL73899.1 MAG: LysR family transcriptional regulator [Rhodococcus sp. (in: high G+C Gram-positive bacteria)]KJV02692.1 putative transcriptional regulator, LysR family protein [Rhodococcus sp. PML026]MBY3793347.1 LysR family transcriptional regulator [Rhodococcus fascians]MBY3826104.1 LysR family transcriptional regulator [Rhodococcus fas
MNIDVQTLRWYAAVAQQLHFARAAQSLGISRIRLSKTVVELEELLGVDLFVPGASPTELTADGRDLLERALVEIAEDDRRSEVAQVAAGEPRSFTIGYAEGVTLTKWTRIWADRFPDVALSVVATTPDTQVSHLRDGTVDVGFVRPPIDREGLNAIGLYQEVQVVVVPKDHAVAAFDSVTALDLADEHLLADPTTVPEWAAVATELSTGDRPALPPMTSTAETFEYVAAGLGVAIVPHSVARFNARKDLVYRPVTDVEQTQIALAWVAEREDDRIEEFIGIVRGRSTRSSRGSSDDAPVKKKKAQPSKPARPVVKTKTNARRSGKRR